MPAKVKSFAPLAVLVGAFVLISASSSGVPAKAGFQRGRHWIPAFAGMTNSALLPAFAGMTNSARLPAFAGMTNSALLPAFAGRTGLDARLTPVVQYKSLRIVQDTGAKLFALTCITCHKANGLGVPDSVPPLAGSEWATGSPARMLRIVLGGMQGEIEVQGEFFNAAMPGWAATLNDFDIAAITSYVRRSWGNKAAAITPETVAQIRRATLDRKTPWTAEELRKIPGDRQAPRPARR